MQKLTIVEKAMIQILFTAWSLLNLLSTYETKGSFVSFSANINKNDHNYIHEYSFLYQMKLLY